MKEKRLSLYQYLINPSNFENDKKPYSGSFQDFEKKFFDTEENCGKLWGVCVSKKGKDGNFLTTGTFESFVAKYACDLNWAKDKEYCRNKTKWTNISTENKTKFESEYTCLKNLSGAQKNVENGGTLLYLKRVEGTKTYYYFKYDSEDFEDPTASKWNGTYMVKENGQVIEKGNFNCKQTKTQ